MIWCFIAVITAKETLQIMSDTLLSN
jgi:hypothetical protein